MMNLFLAVVINAFGAEGRRDDRGVVPQAAFDGFVAEWKKLDPVRIGSVVVVVAL